MSTVTDNYKDDEIDLIELIMTLWQGKLLISIFTVLSVSLAVIFKLVSPPPTFTATTRIYPIPDIIEQQYIFLNQFEYFDFDANYFLLSYVNELQRSEVFDEVILDSGIIEIEGDEFGEDISSTIADYKDKLSVSYIENDVEPASLGHYEVTFVHNDEQEWLTALALLNERLNLLVKSRVNEYFENVVMQVETAANQRLEDISLEVEALREDYDEQVQSRVLFLEEQAEIARSLNIRENSVDAPEAVTLNNLSISVNSDVPYYLRGFDAINKEIELMQNRSEPDAFVPDIQNLKAEERRILRDNTVEQMLDALSRSPASQIDTFAAVDFNIGSTRFSYQQNFSLILALSIVLGIFVGCIVVLIKGALSKRDNINAHNSL